MDIKIYVISNCADCAFVRRLLERKRLPFTEINIDSDEARSQFNEDYPGINLVPFVVVDGQPLARFAQVATLKSPPAQKA